MFKKIGRWIDRAERLLLAAMVLFSISISVAGVFSRYVLNSSLSWVEEVAGIVGVGIIAVGISRGIWEKSHIRVELLQTFLPKTRKALDIISDIVGLVILTYLFALAVQFVYRLLASGQTMTSLEWLQIGWPLVIMPVGYFMGCFRYLELFFNGKNEAEPPK